MQRWFRSLSFLLLASPLRAAISPLAPAVPALVATPLSGDPLKVTVRRLENGLTVYLSPNSQEPRVQAWIAVRSGAKHDPDEATGMAHYLEHMLFKGSENLGTLDFSKEKPHLDRIQALYDQLFKTKDAKARQEIYKQIDQENIAASAFGVPNELDNLYGQLGFQGVNAFTGSEYTVYVCSFPANRMETWARVEADRFSHPVFRLFQTEIEAVYEEKNRSMDNADEILDEAYKPHIYKVHPYGQRTILGSIEHLKNPSLSTMIETFRKNYVPNNMAVALAGDFDPDQALALLSRTLGTWVPKALAPARTWALPPPKGAEKVEVRYEAEEKVLIAWPIVASNHPDADAIELMDMIMDNASTGIINLKLNQKQRVKAAGSYPEFHNDAGDWQVWALPKKDQTLEQAEALLMEAVGSLKAGEFTDEDLKGLITNYEVSQKRELEGNEARVSKMAFSFLGFEEWSRSAGHLDRLRALTKADVLRVANAYLKDNKVIAYRRQGKPRIPSIPKPSFTKVDIDPDKHSSFFKDVAAMPVKPIEPRWALEGKDFKVSRKPRGLFITVPNPVNDLFDLVFSWDRGTKQERNLDIATDLLGYAGTAKLSPEEFKKKLYGLGSAIYSGADERSSWIGLSGLDKNLEATMALLMDLLNGPVVEPDALSKLVQVRLGTYQDNKKNPQIVLRALRQWAERGRDNPVLNSLTEKELLALKTDELLALPRSLLKYKGDIRYTGPRDAAGLAKILPFDLDKDKGEALPAKVLINYVHPSATRVLFTHRDMVQAQEIVTAPDEKLDLNHLQDYFYFSEYVDGGMGSLLFQEIREARALAYSVAGGYTRSGLKGEEGRIWGFVGCQADKTVEATQLLANLLFKPPLTEERFKIAKLSVEQSYRTNPIHFRDLGQQVLAWRDLGLPLKDPGPERFKRALAYTLEDLKKFSAPFAGKPLSIAILGDRTKVNVEGLKKLGAFEEIPLDKLFPY